MRSITRSALAGMVVALVAAVPASATIPKQKLKVSVAPSKAGTKAKPKAIKITFNPFLDTSSPTALAGIDAVPFTTQIAHVYGDKNIVFNTSAFPTCSTAVVQRAATTCPKGSKVGVGSAVGRAIGISQTDFRIQAFNGPNRHLLLLVDGKTPLSIHAVIDGVFNKSTGPYSTDLKFTIPFEIQEPVPGVIAAIANFTTTLSAAKTGKGGKSYVALAGCPKDKKLKFGFKGEFAEYTKGSDGFLIIDKNLPPDPRNPNQYVNKYTSQTVSLKVPCSS